MNFYKLYEAGSEKKYAFAGGYGPVENLWFLKPAFLASKQAFWNINRQLPGVRIETGGTTWPDILGCGNSPPPFFVSERMIESLIAFGARFGRISEMPIAEIKAKALISKTTPRYFVLETLTGIEVDFAASNIPTNSLGEPILVPLPKPWPALINVRGSSWNGADVFAYSNFGESPHLEFLCTERVQQLAQREGWTNLRFDSLPAT